MRIAAPALSLVCVLLSTLAAQADRRVAFVLGNGDYRAVMPLPNPTIDSAAMAAKLRNVGFEVVEGTNLTREGMTAKLIEFGRKAQGADIAVFFYAGHGIAVNGVNYLLPVDADLKSEMDVRLGAAIDVDTTLDQTMGDAKVKLVFLDACRDNPFAERIRSAARTRSVTVGNGLAEMKSGEGTLIAFATGPGQTALDGSAGGNSPFTRALLEHVATPGIEIQQAMTRVRAQVNEETRKQQLPWGHTNLIGDVYLNPAADTAAASTSPGPAVATAAAGPVSSEVELEFWRSIRDSSKVEEFDAYLTNFPNGQFRSIALARIASLKATPPKPEKTLAAGVDPAVATAEASQLTEDRLGLKQAQRRDVQRRLTGLGFDVSATGNFGAETRGVIRRWQAARGYAETGFLNAPQYKALLAEAQPVEERPAVRQAAPRPRVEQPPAGQMQPARPQQSSPFDGAAGAFIGGVIGGALRR